MMTNNLRRIFAFLLTLIMLVSCLPLSLAEQFGGDGIVVAAGENAPAEETPALIYSLQENAPVLHAAEPTALRAAGLLGAPVLDENGNEYESELDGNSIDRVEISWATASAEGSPSSDPDLLYLKPTNDEAQRMVYTLNMVLSGQYDYEPGAIEIEIPATIWQDREGNPVGKLQLSVPEGEEPRVDFNWKRVGDKYIIYNTRTMSAATKAVFQFAYYDIVPHIIEDMKTTELGATVYVGTHHGQTIAKSSNTLQAQMDTRATMIGAVKEGTVYESKPDAMPDELLAQLPEGADPKDYIYVHWYTYANVSANQPFQLSLTDPGWDPNRDEPAHRSGAWEIVNGEEIKRADSVLLGITSGDSVYLPVDGAITIHRPENEFFNGRTPFYYIWTAYQKDAFPYGTEESPRNYDLYNAVNWQLTESDPSWSNGEYEDPQAVANASAVQKKTYSPVFASAGGGLWNALKYTERYGYADYVYSYALNQLQNKQSVDMHFVIEARGFGYPWTYEAQNGDDNQQNPDNYGHRAYSVVAEDYSTFFENGSDELTSDDFEIVAAGLSKPQIFTYRRSNGNETGYLATGANAGARVTIAAGKYGYFPINDDARRPDVEIFVRISDGEWVPYAVASWKTGSLAVTAHPDNSQYAVSASGGKLTLPANTTDYRAIATTTEGGVIYNTTLQVRLKASQRVQKIVEDLFDNSPTPSAKFKNYASVTIYAANASGETPDQLVGQRVASSAATLNTAAYGIYTEKKGTYNENSSVYNDLVNERMVIKYTATVYEQSNVTNRANYNEAVEEGIIPAETSGVWYDLLPPRVQPVLSTVKLRNGDSVASASAIQNYKGSGRTLLVVRGNLTPTPVLRQGYWTDAPSISFDAYYTYDDYKLAAYEAAQMLIQSGMAPDAAADRAAIQASTLKNYIAFESGTAVARLDTDEGPISTFGTIVGRQGESDGEDTHRNKGTPNLSEVLAYIKGLNPSIPDNDYRTVYAVDTTAVSRLAASWSELRKYVASAQDGIWTSGLHDGSVRVNVFEGQQYVYQLQVESSQDFELGNIVIFDALDGFDPSDPGVLVNPPPAQLADKNEAEARKAWAGAWQGKGHWRGTLVAVDLSEMLAMYPKLQPRVYYTTDPAFTFPDVGPSLTQEEIIALEGREEYNPTPSSTLWKLMDDPGNPPAGVTAVAVDLTKTLDDDGNLVDFVLPVNSSVQVFLHMQAPTGQDAIDAYAHKDDNTTIDWDKAVDPDNNLHAFNNVRARYISINKNSPTAVGHRSISHYDYTKVGIMPLSIGVEKVWADNDNHDGVRPDSVTLYLVKTVYSATGEGGAIVVDENGVPQIDVPVLDETGAPLEKVADRDSSYVDEFGSPHNGWSVRFENLPSQDANGNPIVYAIREKEVGRGYTESIARVNGQNYRLTNRRENEKAQLSGVKEWDDGDDINNVRPASITLRLYADGKFVRSQQITPNAEGVWAWAFTGLDRYEPFSDTLKTDPTATQPREIVYTVTEDYVPGYVLPDADPDGVLALPADTIVNLHHPEGTLRVTKETRNVTGAEKEFTFTLNLFEATGDDVLLLGAYAYTIINSSGEEIDAGSIRSGGTFTLKNGDTFISDVLPSEARYEVTEASLPGYTTEAKGATGVIRAGAYNAATAAFTNTYNAHGDATLSVGKKLAGHATGRSQFRFQLYDQNNTLLRTASNGAPGADGTATAHFGALHYTLADLKKDDGTYAPSKTFTYTVREENRGRAGYTYDESAKTITVTVTDNGDGTLACAIEPADLSTLVFSNSYKAEGDVRLKVWKELEGRRLLDGEFNFELFSMGEVDSDDISNLEFNVSDVDGMTPLQVKTNNAYGEVAFDPIHFIQDATHDVANKTYLYLVREQTGSDDTVVHTDYIHAFSVAIYDNNDGTLNYGIGNHVATRDTVCRNCNGYGYTNIGSITNVYGLPRFNQSTEEWEIVNTKIKIPAEDIEIFSKAICRKCNGCGIVPGDSCVDCLDSGLIRSKVNAIADYYLQKYPCFDAYTVGFVYRQSIYLQSYYTIAFTGERNSTVTFEWWPIRDVRPFSRCEMCDGTGIYHGIIDITEDNDLPLFTNELKPGSLSITKALANDDKSPLTPFVYRVKLITNKDLPNTLSYSVSGTPAGESDIPQEEPIPDSSKYYRIRFRVGSSRSVGEHPDVIVPVDQPYTLPGAGSFTQTGYTQSYWRWIGGARINNHSSTYYDLGETIPANSVWAGTTVIFEPSFNFNNTRVQIENNEFTVSLFGGETVTFNNLPAGTSYQIVEVLPAGWVLVETENASGVIQPLETSAAKFTNSYQPSKAQAQFYAAKMVRMSPGATAVAADPTAADQTHFRFELWKDGVKIADQIEMQPGGLVAFPAQTFNLEEDADKALYTTENGATYTYTLKETADTAADDAWLYDTTEYEIPVRVWSRDGLLYAEAQTATGSLPTFVNTKRFGALELTKETLHATQAANDHADAAFEFTLTFTGDKGQPLDDLWYYIREKDGAVNGLRPAQQAQQSAGAQNAALLAAAPRAAANGLLRAGSAPAVDTSKQVHISDLSAEEQARIAGTVGRAYIGNKDGVKTLVFFRTENADDPVPQEIQDQYGAPASSGAVYGDVEHVGTPPWRGSAYTKVVTADYIRPSSMFYWFAGTSERDLKTIREMDLSKLDTSNCRSMDFTFAYQSESSLSTLDLSTFDTSNCTSMDYMFYFNTGVKNIDLSSFDTQNVQYMFAMFMATLNLTNADVSGFDTSSLKGMERMFYTAGQKTTTGVKLVDLSNFNLNQKLLTEVFRGSNIYELILDGKVFTSWSYSFGSPKSVRILHIQGVDTSAVAYSGYSSILFQPFGGLIELYTDENTNLQFIRDGEVFHPNITSHRGAFNGNLYTSYWVNVDTGEYVQNNVDQYRIPHTVFEGSNAGHWVKATVQNVYEYDANGGQFAPGTAPGLFVHNSTSQTADDLDDGSNLTRTGFLFDGWADEDGNKITALPELTLPDNYLDDPEPDLQNLRRTRLYAQWTENPGPFDVPVYEHLQAQNLSGYTVQTRMQEGCAFGEPCHATPRDIPGYVFVAVAADGSASSPEEQTFQSTDADPGWHFYYDRITYAIHFDPNGGEGEMDDMKDLLGDVNYVLPANAFTKGNSKFLGWTDENGTLYPNLATVKNLATEDKQVVNLVAVWFDIDDQDLDPTTGQMKLTLREGQTAVFPELPAGVTYEIAETKLPKGWTLAGIDADQGRIESNRTNAETARNRYDAKGSAVIEAIKLLEGGTPQDGQFTFRLYATEADARNGENPLGEGTNILDTNPQIPNPDQDETDPDSPQAIQNPHYGQSVARLSVMDYTLDMLQDDPAADPLQSTKEFTYWMAEAQPQENDPAYDPTIEYDTEPRQITVTVTDQGDGTLRAEATVPQVKNRYLKATLQLTKQVLGATAASDGRAYPVTITLLDGQGNALNGAYALTRYSQDGTESSEQVTVAEGEMTLDIHADETIVMELPHNARYTVTEEALDGFTVTYMGESSGSVQYHAENHPDQPQAGIPQKVDAQVGLVNTYEASGQWTLEGTKTLTGAEMEAGQFTFELLDENGELVESVTNGDATDGEAPIIFAPVSFTADDVGDKTYTVYEVRGDAPGYTYSDRAYTYTVTVIDNGDGTLDTRAVSTIDATDDVVSDTSGKLVFNNKYNLYGSAEIKVNKQLTGRAWKEEDSFAFELTPVDNAPLRTEEGEQAVLSGTVTADTPDHCYIFPELTFELSDLDGAPEKTFAYTLHEVVEEPDTENADGTRVKDDITYPADKQVTITVRNDGQGSLAVTYGRDQAATLSEEDITFVNSLGGSVTITGKKTWVDGEKAHDNENEITLTLKRSSEGTPEEAVNDATPAWDGDTYIYSDLHKYDEDGYEYTYTVEEEELPGYTTTQEGNDFTNVIKPVAIDPPVEKKVTGQGATEETFRFQLTAKDDAPMPKGSADGVKTVEIEGAGSVEFGEITYTEPGTWTYTVEELPGEAEGYAYDETVWTLTVEVTAEETGLAAKKTVTAEGKEAADTAVFENVYTAPTPTPTATPEPTPTPTPNPYQYKFSFTKKWQGDAGDSIDWTFYNPDDTERSKKFDKKIISETEWYYEGWFASEADYYLVEKVPEGYMVHYENVGAHAGETDRCYNGGTIINYKVPKTGDDANPALWIALAALGIGGLALLLKKRRASAR